MTDLQGEMTNKLRVEIVLVPNKSFPFSALIPLRGLFTASSRHSLQAASALDLIAAVRFPTPSENRKTKSFPFSALIPLRGLFTASSRHSLQAASALGLIAAVRFPTPSENRKTKSFPFSAFRFPFFRIFVPKFEKL